MALERGWAVVGEIYSMKTISSDATGEVHHFAHENNMLVRKGTLLTGDGDKNTALGYAVDLQDQWVVATDKDFDAVLTRSGSEGVAYRTPFYDVFNNRDTRMGSDITDLNLSNEVSIYPNPASEKINISSNNTIVSVTAVNASSNSVKLSVENNTVDISQLPSGIYMLNIQTESNMVTEKLIVK